MANWENNEEIQYFREYLRIKSVQPDPDYESCVKFLKRQAANIGVPYEVVYPGGKNKPIFIFKFLGSDPSLPSIMLNSHMDVVPVFEENWKYPPFEAHMDEEGKIYARGTQDMKSVGMQYLGALRALRKQNFQHLRTIYVTFVPDEEIHSHKGMGSFVKTDTFKKMNVGFGMDEGAASNSDLFGMFYGERILWQIKFKINGSPGHGSILLQNTVGEKLTYLLNKLNTYRNSQIDTLSRFPHPLYFLGEVTTINLTKINGGVQTNVIPSYIEMVYDCRISPKANIEEFESNLRQWCKDAGEDVDFEFIEKDAFVEPTKIDESNHFWTALKKVFDEQELKILPIICPGNSDGRHLRLLGIPVIGFSPMNNTPVLLHDHNEYLSADIYLKGIDIYKQIIPAIANVQ